MNANLQSSTVLKTLIPPQIGTDNTAIVSSIIDTKGYPYVEIGLLTGTLADADATFTTLVEDGDDSGLSDNEGVPDANLQGTESAAGFTFADDDEVRRIGVRPRKRYLRVTVTPVNNTGNAPVSGFAMLSGAQYGPPTQPES